MEKSYNTMKVIKNKIIPFKGYKAIAIYPFIFTKSDLTDVDLNHELIHGEQQKELLVIFFFIIYLIEWIFKKYRDISFEKEAYSNQDNLNYIEWIRKPFAMWRK